MLPCALAAASWLLIAAAPSQAFSTAGWQWFKTDLHTHSAVSGDAINDIGLVTQAGKAHGYNAMFFTDHQAGSNFAISTVVANHIEFDDDLGTKWVKRTFGSQTATVNELATTPVTSGTKSLHLKSSSGSSGETFVSIKRGPNLRSGDLILKASVYPTQITAGSGAYVSASIGGDPTTSYRDGYTTQAGVISPGKTTVLVWQLGTPLAASSNPMARVIASSLPYTLNTWNNYVINVTQGTATLNGGAPFTVAGLGTIPVADRPLDYNALLNVKMSTRANLGTAEAYFDAFHLDASSPVPSGDEFVYRNTRIHDYDTSSFAAFPAIEMGYNRHAQRLNFGITTGQQYKDFFQCTDALMTKCTVDRGIEGIGPTQQTGYPAQLNHPDLPGGVKLSEIQADNYQAFGADLMEVRPDTDGVPPTAMIDVWDSMLQRGTSVLGTWTTDMHKLGTLDDLERGVATYLFASQLTLDGLMRSLFEGRSYMARNTFTGRLAFNLDSASSEPYPARYPVYVSDAATSADVHLGIDGGIASGSSVRWLVNGSQTASDSAGSSYNATKSISLAGASTYARTELHDSGAGVNHVAMTQPISFRDVAGLPAAMSFHLDSITTDNGRNYTRLVTKGITSPSWNGVNQALSLTLDNPAQALSELSLKTGGSTPTRVTVGGTQLTLSPTRADFDAATGSSWFYDAPAGVVRVKAKQGNGPTPVVVGFSLTSDIDPPGPPANVAAAASGPTTVNVTWTAATDNVAVTGYDVYRGVGGNTPTLLTTINDGAATSYSDTTAQASTTYTYCVVAFDAAGNHSQQACAAPVTTPAGGGGGTGTVTFHPVADTYVGADTPGTSFGTSTKLRVDASPDVRSFLRFDLRGLAGQQITAATLRVFANSSLTAGFDVRGVGNTSWGETTTTYGNAPSVDGSVTRTSGPASTGQYATVDVTALFQNAQLTSIALLGRSSTALSLASREDSAHAPELVLTTSSADADPPTPPGDVQASTASPTQVDLTWTAATDDVAVTGYGIYRGTGSDTPALIATIDDGAATSYSDDTAEASTTYTYCVDAFDAADHRSDQACAPPVTTPADGGGGDTTFNPAADAYVSADTPGRNFGGTNKLRVDTSPEVRSYLRFDLSGLAGQSISSAKLRVFANSQLNAGFDVRGVDDNDWNENDITFSNAPDVGGNTETSGRANSGEYVEIDVTSLVDDTAPVSIALVGRSTTALSLASREDGSHPPELVVETS